MVTPLRWEGPATTSMWALGDGVHSYSVQAVTPSVTKRQVRVPITQRGHTIPKCQFGADKGLRRALQGEGVYALKSPNCPKALS